MWEDVLLTDMRITACMASRTKIPTEGFRVYASGAYRLHYPIEGTGTLYTEHRAIRLVPHSLYLLPSALSYTVSLDKDHPHYDYLYFNFMLTRPLCFHSILTFSCTENDPLYHQLNAAALYFEMTPPHKRQKSSDVSLLAAILSLLNATSPLPYLSHEGIERALSHIHTAYATKITVGDLARIARMEETAFIRAFKRMLFTSPHSYLTELRVREALLLMKTGIRAAEAASTVGFTSASAFSAACRRQYGVPPINFVLSLK